MENLFFELLDVEKCKQAVKKTASDELTILMGHYSINIQSKYNDGELLQAHFEDFEEKLGYSMSISDYDDLVVDLRSDEDDEGDEYTIQADNFLKNTGTKLDIEFLKFGLHFEDDTQPRNIFKCTLSRNGKAYTFNFGNSIASSCKQTPNIFTPFKCEIYWGVKFTFDKPVYYSHTIKTDYPTLLKIKNGEISARDIIVIDSIKHDDFIAKVGKRKVPNELKNIESVATLIEARIHKFISESEEKTTLYGESDEVIFPSSYDVLTAVTKNDVGTFENFCSDYGYDQDSRKAYKTYQALTNEFAGIQLVFGDVLDQLNEIQ